MAQFQGRGLGSEERLVSSVLRSFLWNRHQEWKIFSPILRKYNLFFQWKSSTNLCNCSQPCLPPRSSSPLPPRLPAAPSTQCKGCCVQNKRSSVKCVLVSCLSVFLQSLREAPTKKVPLLFGHCPNCDCTPPPHSTGHSGALYFQTNLSNFVKSPFWWW